MRFWFIGDALEWVLQYIYNNIVGNYAIAVLLFTVVIYVVLLPLDVKSKRGMMRMAKVNPQVEAIKKKYEKDPAKCNQKISELYRKEKASPMSGCLPMLLRLPILFALFAVMRDLANEGTVKMLLDIKAHLDAGESQYEPILQSFLWIKNVLQPDSLFSTVFPAAVSDVTKALAGFSTTSQVTTEMLTQAREFLASEAYATWVSTRNTTWYNGSMMGLWTITIPHVFNGWCVLPPLAAISQFLSSKLLSATSGQAQPADSNAGGMSKMMQYLFPVMSLFICFTSNAVFALYWVFSAVLQSVEQLLIGKWVEYSDAKKASKEELQA